MSVLRTVVVVLLALSLPVAAAEVKGVFYNSEKPVSELLLMLDDPAEVAAAKDYEPDFLRVCELYLASNRFHDFFQCIDELEQTRFRYASLNLHEHDLVAQANGEMQYGTDTLVYWRFARPRAKRLRLEALYRLNDFEQAYRVGREAMAQYLEYSGGIEALERQAVNEAPLSSWANDIMLTAGLTALSAIEQGHLQEARSLLATLRRLHTKYANGWTEPDLIRDAYIRMVQIQLGDAEGLSYSSWEAHKRNSYILGSVMTAVGLFSGEQVISGGMNLLHGADIEESERLRMQLGNARLAVLKQDAPRALQDYQGVIEHQAIGNYAELHWVALFERGRFYAGRGELAAAEQDLQAAVELIEASRGNLSTESMKIGFSGSKSQVYQQLVAVLIRRGNSAQAFAMAERSRARSMIDMLADEELQNRDSQLLAVVGASSATAGPQQAEGGESQRALKRKLKAARRQQPQAASLLAVDPAEFEGLPSLIGDGETLVEYFKTADSWYVFVVTPRQTRVVELGAIDVALQSQALRASLADNSAGDYRHLAEQLYRQLWQPLQPFIKGDDIVLVVDGALNYVPMTALHDGEKFLLQRYRSIRQLPSLAASRYIPAPTRRASSTLVLGNPTGDLPGAEAEALRVAGLYRDHKLLLQQRATKTSLLEQAANYRNLHVASHGVYESAAPLDSYLLLADGDGGAERLTVAELYRVKLNNDLVVLSGCETGLNEIANGNDLLGFTRGFLFAGSRSIVSSLWLVDDEATALLMTEFHRGLSSQGKARALNRAQRRVLEKYPHPYYWAAFQLTGAK